MFTRKGRVKHQVDSVHNRVRYKCPVEGCDAMFTQKCDAKRHVDSVVSSWRLWSNVHPKWNVKEHVDSVHNNFQYQCPVEDCDKMFTQKGSVRHHVDSVNSNVRYPCPVEYCYAILTDTAEVQINKWFQYWHQRSTLRPNCWYGEFVSKNALLLIFTTCFRLNFSAGQWLHRSR